MKITVNSILLVGLTAVLGVVEAISGVPTFELTGPALTEAAGRETRVRVRAALSQTGFSADGVALSCWSSEGASGAYDLAAAVAVLAALGRFPTAALEGTAFLGELSLTNVLQPVRGVLPALRGAAALGIRRVVVPTTCAAEAALVDGVEVLVAQNLADVVTELVAAESDEPHLIDARSFAGVKPAQADNAVVDMADVRGNLPARRALEIAAAGGHSLLLVGPPGAGKTMLARRLATIMPPLTGDEALDVTALHSVAGLLGSGWGLVSGRPFRAPHHTISPVNLVGGGDPPRPGEASLAHHGVLFLDEVDQFKRTALEVLDGVLRAGKADVVRRKFRTSLPAQPLVVCTAGPCPCGFRGDARLTCTCSGERVAAYRARFSGAVVGRMQLAVRVGNVDAAQLVKGRPGESSANVRERVVAARKVQEARYADAAGGWLKHNATLDDAAIKLLYQATERLPLTASRAAEVTRVARTIADLDGSATVGAPHVAEAVCYVPERVFS